MASFQRPSWSTASWTHASKPFRSVGSEFYEPYPCHSVNDSRHAEEACRVQSPNLSQLSPFETVADQFSALGLQIEGAIALQPSNPIFWVRQQAVVLMPATGRRSIDLIFQQPAHYVCVSVLGVREVRLVATTCDRQHLLQRSANPNRALRRPTDLMEPLEPCKLEVEGDTFTQVRLESSHPFVIATILYQVEHFR